MSKSLQKGILFAVCIALVCALGVTLFIFVSTVRIQEGVLRELILPYLPVTHFIMQLKATPRIFFLRAI